MIASNPQNYWRLNEGPGATAALDYGNQPGMLWPAYVQNNGIAWYGMPGYGYGGITADGGSLEVGPCPLDSRTSPPSTSVNRYVPLPDPGTLEFWWFVEDSTSGFNVEWTVVTGGAVVASHGLSVLDNLWSAITVNGPLVNGVVSNLGQWHHIAMSWANSAGFVYLDGTQVAPLTYTSPIGGSHVWFQVGSVGDPVSRLNTHGLVSEIATYRTALSVGDLDAHFNQAELKGQRPHWIGPRVSLPTSTEPSLPTYSLGVTHLARTGTAVIPVPTGLRGMRSIIQATPPTHRQLAGQPPYDWDVGWMTISNADGLLEQVRITRDSQIWLPNAFALGNSFGYYLQPDYTVDFTELDPV